MNAFKAWWTCRLKIGGPISAEEVWKAALEWAKNVSGFTNETTIAIEKELEK